MGESCFAGRRSTYEGRGIHSLVRLRLVSTMHRIGSRSFRVVQYLHWLSIRRSHDEGAVRSPMGHSVESALEVWLTGDPGCLHRHLDPSQQDCTALYTSGPINARIAKALQFRCSVLNPHGIAKAVSLLARTPCAMA